MTNAVLRTDKRQACGEAPVDRVHAAIRGRRAAAVAVPLWITLSLAAAAWALWYFGGPSLVSDITHEGGPVERATELMYFVAAGGMWALRRPQDSWRTWLALCTTLAAFGAREMDWHKAWTGTSVLKVSFYIGPAPTHQKLFGLMAVLAAAGAVGYLLARHAAATWRALRAGHPVAATVAGFVGLLLVSKVLDRSVNILADDFQVAVSERTHALVSSFEEILELGLPLLAAAALLQNRFGRPVPPR